MSGLDLSTLAPFRWRYSSDGFCRSLGRHRLRTAPNLIRGSVMVCELRVIGSFCDEPLPPASKMVRD
jgi:hypothetical protein